MTYRAGIIESRIKRTADALTFAESLRPIVEELLTEESDTDPGFGMPRVKTSRRRSIQEIRDELNARGVRGRRGGTFNYSMVLSLLERLQLPVP